MLFPRCRTGGIADVTSKRKISELPLHAMLLPAVILVLIFSYGPMAGLVIAFQKFNMAKGILNSPWIGWENFRYVMELPGTFPVIRNTLLIALAKMVLGLVVPIVTALMLNEVAHRLFKRTVQTVIYLPHFFSWVILSGILIDVLSPSKGLVNLVLDGLGLPRIFFLGDPQWFPVTLVLSDVWKEFGFGTIVFLAALTAVDPVLYEAAIVDGAGRWRQTWHVTLPGISPIVILMATLSLGNILNAGFDQVFNLYSPRVYSTGDIIDTFVYRLGLVDFQFGVSTAVGLFKSFVSLILISLSYFLAYRYANYRIF